MGKPVLHIVALLLVPCLVADPVTAAGLSSLSVIHALSKATPVRAQDRFNQEAFEPVGVPYTHRPIVRRLMSRWTAYYPGLTMKPGHIATAFVTLAGVLYANAALAAHTAHGAIKAAVTTFDRANLGPHGLVAKTAEHVIGYNKGNGLWHVFKYVHQAGWGKIPWTEASQRAIAEANPGVVKLVEVAKGHWEYRLIDLGTQGNHLNVPDSLLGAAHHSAAAPVFPGAPQLHLTPPPHAPLLNPPPITPPVSQVSPDIHAVVTPDFHHVVASYHWWTDPTVILFVVIGLLALTAAVLIYRQYARAAAKQNVSVGAAMRANAAQIIRHGIHLWHSSRSYASVLGWAAIESSGEWTRRISLALMIRASVLYRGLFAQEKPPSADSDHRIVLPEIPVRPPIPTLVPLSRPLAGRPPKETPARPQIPELTSPSSAAQAPTASAVRSPAPEPAVRSHSDSGTPGPHHANTTTAGGSSVYPLNFYWQRPAAAVPVLSDEGIRHYLDPTTVLEPTLMEDLPTSVALVRVSVGPDNLPPTPPSPQVFLSLRQTMAQAARAAAQRGLPPSGETFYLPQDIAVTAANSAVRVVVEEPPLPKASSRRGKHVSERKLEDSAGPQAAPDVPEQTPPAAHRPTLAPDPAPTLGPELVDQAGRKSPEFVARSRSDTGNVNPITVTVQTPPASVIHQILEAAETAGEPSASTIQSVVQFVSSLVESEPARERKPPASSTVGTSVADSVKTPAKTAVGTGAIGGQIERSQIASTYDPGFKPKHLAKPRNKARTFKRKGGGLRGNDENYAGFEKSSKHKQKGFRGDRRPEVPMETPGDALKNAAGRSTFASMGRSPVRSNLAEDPRPSISDISEAERSVRPATERRRNSRRGSRSKESSGELWDRFIAAQNRSRKNPRAHSDAPISAAKRTGVVAFPPRHPAELTVPDPATALAQSRETLRSNVLPGAALETSKPLSEPGQIVTGHDAAIKESASSAIRPVRALLPASTASKPDIHSVIVPKSALHAQVSGPAPAGNAVSAGPLVPVPQVTALSRVQTVDPGWPDTPTTPDHTLLPATNESESVTAANEKSRFGWGWLKALQKRLRGNPKPASRDTLGLGETTSAEAAPAPTLPSVPQSAPVAPTGSPVFQVAPAAGVNHSETALVHVGQPRTVALARGDTGLVAVALPSPSRRGAVRTEPDNTPRVFHLPGTIAETPAAAAHQAQEPVAPANLGAGNPFSPVMAEDSHPASPQDPILEILEIVKAAAALAAAEAAGAKPSETALERVDQPGELALVRVPTGPGAVVSPPQLRRPAVRTPLNFTHGVFLLPGGIAAPETETLISQAAEPATEPATGQPTLAARAASAIMPSVDNAILAGGDERVVRAENIRGETLEPSAVAVRTTHTIPWKTVGILTLGTAMALAFSLLISRYHTAVSLNTLGVAAIVVGLVAILAHLIRPHKSATSAPERSLPSDLEPAVLTMEQPLLPFQGVEIAEGNAPAKEVAEPPLAAVAHSVLEVMGQLAFPYQYYDYPELLLEDYQSLSPVPAAKADRNHKRELDRKWDSRNQRDQTAKEDERQSQFEAPPRHNAHGPAVLPHEELSEGIGHFDLLGRFGPMPGLHGVAKWTVPERPKGEPAALSVYLAAEPSHALPPSRVVALGRLPFEEYIEWDHNSIPALEEAEPSPAIAVLAAREALGQLAFPFQYYDYPELLLEEYQSLSPAPTDKAHRDSRLASRQRDDRYQWDDTEYPDPKSMPERHTPAVLPHEEPSEGTGRLDLLGRHGPIPGLHGVAKWTLPERPKGEPAALPVYLAAEPSHALPASRVYDPWRLNFDEYIDWSDYAVPAEQIAEPLPAVAALAAREALGQLAFPFQYYDYPELLLEGYQSLSPIPDDKARRASRLTRRQRDDRYHWAYTAESYPLQRERTPPSRYVALESTKVVDTREPRPVERLTNVVRFSIPDRLAVVHVCSPQEFLDRVEVFARAFNVDLAAKTKDHEELEIRLSMLEKDYSKSIIKWERVYQRGSEHDALHVFTATIAAKLKEFKNDLHSRQAQDFLKSLDPFEARVKAGTDRDTLQAEKNQLASQYAAFRAKWSSDYKTHQGVAFIESIGTKLRAIQRLLDSKLEEAPAAAPTGRISRGSRWASVYARLDAWFHEAAAPGAGQREAGSVSPANATQGASERSAVVKQLIRTGSAAQIKVGTVLPADITTPGDSERAALKQLIGIPSDTPRSLLTLPQLYFSDYEFLFDLAEFDEALRAGTATSEELQVQLDTLRRHAQESGSRIYSVAFTQLNDRQVALDTRFNIGPTATAVRPSTSWISDLRHRLDALFHEDRSPARTQPEASAVSSTPVRPIAQQGARSDSRVTQAVRPVYLSIYEFLFDLADFDLSRRAGVATREELQTQLDTLRRHAQESGSRIYSVVFTQLNNRQVALDRMLTTAANQHASPDSPDDRAAPRQLLESASESSPTSNPVSRADESGWASFKRFLETTGPGSSAVIPTGDAVSPAVAIDGRDWMPFMERVNQHLIGITALFTAVLLFVISHFHFFEAQARHRRVPKVSNGGYSPHVDHVVEVSKQADGFFQLSPMALGSILVVVVLVCAFAAYLIVERRREQDMGINRVLEKISSKEIGRDLSGRNRTENAYLRGVRKEFSPASESSIQQAFNEKNHPDMHAHVVATIAAALNGDPAMIALLNEYHVDWDRDTLIRQAQAGDTEIQNLLEGAGMEWRVQEKRGFWEWVGFIPRDKAERIAAQEEAAATSASVAVRHPPHRFDVLSMVWLARLALEDNFENLPAKLLQFANQNNLEAQEIRDYFDERGYPWRPAEGPFLEKALRLLSQIKLAEAELVSEPWLDPGLPERWMTESESLIREALSAHLLTEETANLARNRRSTAPPPIIQVHAAIRNAIDIAQSLDALRNDINRGESRLNTASNWALKAKRISFNIIRLNKQRPDAGTAYAAHLKSLELRIPQANRKLPKPSSRPIPVSAYQAAQQAMQRGGAVGAILTFLRIFPVILFVLLASQMFAGAIDRSRAEPAARTALPTAA